MKYKFLFRKSEIVGTKHFNDSKALIEYSNDMDDLYENITRRIQTNQKT